MFASAEISKKDNPAAKKRRITQAVVLAAGEGTRLRPFTLDRPKPMVDIAGQPLLGRTLRWLRSYGVSEVVINLHYKPAVIPTHFGFGSGWDLRIKYSHESRLLGSAGALKHCEAQLQQTFYLIYGDILTDVNLGRLQQFHQEIRSDGRTPAVTAGVYVVPNPTECGIVELSAGSWIKRVVEKPPANEVFSDLALSGLFVMERDVVSEVPAGSFFDVGRDLLPKLLAKNYPMAALAKTDDEYLLDIGSHEKYASACKDWAGR